MKSLFLRIAFRGPEHRRVVASLGAYGASVFKQAWPSGRPYFVMTRLLDLPI